MAQKLFLPHISCASVLYNLEQKILYTLYTDIYFFFKIEMSYFQRI